MSVLVWCLREGMRGKGEEEDSLKERRSEEEEEKREEERNEAEKEATMEAIYPVGEGVYIYSEASVREEFGS